VAAFAVEKLPEMNVRFFASASLADFQQQTLSPQFEILHETNDRDTLFKIQEEVGDLAKK
jgi:hypothetical protein